VQVIDGFGGEGMTHKQIAQKLQEDKLLETGLAGKDQNVGWWCQSVTVGYEKIKGRRVLGQSADAGFQVGVHKTIHRSADEVWELLLSPAGLKVWLGDIPELVLEKKHAYATKGGKTLRGTRAMRGLMPSLRSSKRIAWYCRAVTFPISNSKSRDM
jgi:hypothetical protein